MFRIIPSEHSTNYFELQKRTAFGWRYVKSSRDKEELRVHAQHMRSEPEYIEG